QALAEKLDAMNDNINRMLEIQEEQARQLALLHHLVPADKKALLADLPRQTPPVKDEPSSVFHAASQYHENKTDPYMAEEFALPVKHPTAAQNLLSSPSVRILMPKDRPEDYTQSYVIDLEPK